MNEKNRMPSLAEPLWATYIQQKGATLGLPIAGNFELTPRCNFSCKMCYVHQQVAKSEELSAEEWIELGKQARDRGMLFLLLTGGEPLIREDFKEIYHELKRLGLMVSINTNASLVDDHMVEFFRNDPPTRMNITLYGGSDETYERLCGVRMYSRVTENIRKLNRVGIPIKINASITPYNADDIESVFAFAKGENLRVKATSYMYPPVRINECKYGSAPDRFTAEQAAEYMVKCKENDLTREQLSLLAKRISVEDERECTGPEGNKMQCRAGKTAFWIKWNGHMIPCGMFPYSGYSVGEIGFDAAWKKVREYTDSIRLPSQCTNCPSRMNCSVCAAACYAETGKFDKRPQYVCCITKTMEKIIQEKYGEEISDEN